MADRKADTVDSVDESVYNSQLADYLAILFEQALLYLEAVSVRASRSTEFRKMLFFAV